MDALSLPPYPCRTRTSHGVQEIFDTYRRRYVALTPEEWVRQHFCHYLTDKLHYPSGRLCNEYKVSINGMPKRSDTVIFDAQMAPLVVIEYKAPSVEITQSVFDQAVRYNRVLMAPYIFVSNGRSNYACHLDVSNGQVTFLKEIPPYEAL